MPSFFKSLFSYVFFFKRGGSVITAWPGAFLFFLKRFCFLEFLD